MTHQPLEVLACFSEEPPPLDFVLPNMLAGTVGALVSPGGAGKSMLAMQLAAQIAGGPNLLGIGSLPTGKTAYLPAEDPSLALQHRLHALGSYLSGSQRMVIADAMLVQPLIGACPDIMDKGWYETLMRLASGCRLMIMDTLRRFHSRDENDSGAMAQVIGRMEAIAAETGCSIIFLHHSSKGAALNGQGDQQQASRGSSVLVDNVRWQAYLTGMTAAEAEKMGVAQGRRGFFVRFGINKVNYGPWQDGIWLRRHEGGILKLAVLEPHRKLKEEKNGYNG